MSKRLGFILALLLVPIAAAAQIFPGPFFGPFPGLSIAYLQSLTSNDSGSSGFSYRNAVALLAGGTQARVIFHSSSADTWVVAHAAIGIQDTGANTLATPVELTFSGVSGFSLGINSAITSDWVTLTTANGNTAIVIEDTTSGDGRNGTAGSLYFKAASASYNQATVTGYTLIASAVGGFAEIDVRP